MNVYRRTTYRLRAAVGMAAVSVLLLSSGASAQDEEMILADFPAGVACEFPVRLEFPAPSRTDFGDGVLFAGRNGPLTITNLATSESLVQPTRGTQVRLVSVAPDGTQTQSASGNLVLALFPTDVPAGPSLVLYVGRLVYTISPEGVYTIVSQEGRTVDLCAALS
ncbi:MAG: hypothetical protein ACR2FV_11725 [Ornithinimicrobium sp.]|uniref:hypothetical protein n=1 Tax=Ornithinimicrobium sp. TaxID=1977084 RepID=UPI00185C3E27|nr:hypothetical protein [Actinomycetota bacterium]